MTPKVIAHALPLQKNRSFLPSAPQRVEDTGLDFSFLVELLTKVLYVRGQLRLPDLSARPSKASLSGQSCSISSARQ